MIKDLSVDEVLFGLGIYPALKAADKYQLFKELMVDFFNDDEQMVVNEMTDKKLSLNKKASFLSFLKEVNFNKEMKKYQEKNVQWLHLLSDNYPETLKSIYAPPVVLFYQGDIRLLKQYTWLGVVGSREYTHYGQQVTEVILEDLLLKAKIGIVSGLAKGIDTEAHIQTIKSRGVTVGVIGSGLDVYYPYNNRSLQQFLAQEHLVLSEYPLGSKPLSFHFPERNRIIAGLSRGILVIEAKKSSGSLITAYNAIDENRDIFAVPGSIFEDNREGTHRLIRSGAVPTTKADDILSEWRLI
jgi:DNA processing protein